MARVAHLSLRLQGGLFGRGVEAGSDRTDPPQSALPDRGDRGPESSKTDEHLGTKETLIITPIATRQQQSFFLNDPLKKIQVCLWVPSVQHQKKLPNSIGDMDRSPSPEFSPLAFDEGLTPLPEIKKPGTTALDFSGLLNEPVKLHEDLKTGCGGQLWPAGMVLAKHMLRYHRDKLHEARMSVTLSSTETASDST